MSAERIRMDICTKYSYLYPHHDVIQFENDYDKFRHVNI